MSQFRNLRFAACIYGRFFYENGFFRDELLGSAIANREHLRFGSKEDYAIADSQNYDETTLANCRFLKKNY
nr:hypothetical protein [uncultured Pedobacter sp.]